MTNPDITFVVAMACEAEAVTRHLRAAQTATLFGRPVTTGTLPDGRRLAVVECGVGKVNAAAGAQIALGTLGASALYNAGLAGGLKPDMRVLAVYGVSAAVEHDFDLAKLNGTGPGVLNEYDSALLPLEVPDGFPTAICASGDAFSDDPREAERLVRSFDAGLRDMELGAIAHVCRRAGVPCVSLKAVTDVAGGSEPMTAQYVRNRAAGLERLSEAVGTLLERIGRMKGVARVEGC